MPFQPSDIDKFVWLAREDVPNSPLPILRRLTQRVLRDFTTETYCLNRQVDTDLELSPELDITPIPDPEGRVILKTIPGEKEVFVEDAPPGGVVEDGRVPDVGQTVWGRDDEFGDIWLYIPGVWGTLEAVFTPVGVPGAYSIYADLGSSDEWGEPVLTVEFELGAGLSVNLYADETHSYEDPSFEIAHDESIRVDVSVGDAQTSVAINGTGVWAFDNIAGYPPSEDGHFQLWGQEDPVLSSSVSWVAAYGKEVQGKTVITLAPGVTGPGLAIFITNDFASTVPEDLMFYNAAIKHGVLARLLAQENKPWSNPTLAELNRLEYEKAKGDAKAAFFRNVDREGG